MAENVRNDFPLTFPARFGTDVVCETISGLVEFVGYAPTFRASHVAAPVAGRVELTGQTANSLIGANSSAVAGRLTVVERHFSDDLNPKRAYWLCACDCGKSKVTSGKLLRNGSTVSCGCGRVKDITGQRFNKLTVIKRFEGKLNVIDTNNAAYWLCMCDCGSTSVVMGRNLRSGHTKSCGCLTTETHGCGTHPLMPTWRHMIKRCYDHDNEHYKNYGGRGIRVCDRWLNDPNNFINDMGERPERMTLDRIDNDGDYTPENCKWSTRTEQTRNRRNTKTITYKGETKPLAEWCEKLGIPYQKVYQRLWDGWSIDQAFQYEKGEQPSLNQM